MSKSFASTFLGLSASKILTYSNFVFVIGGVISFIGFLFYGIEELRSIVLGFIGGVVALIIHMYIWALFQMVIEGFLNLGRIADALEESNKKAETNAMMITSTINKGQSVQSQVRMENEQVNSDKVQNSIVDDFYIYLDNTKTGPLKDSDIRSLVAEGKINSQTLMWKKGMADWTPAGKIPEISMIIQTNS